MLTNPPIYLSPSSLATGEEIFLVRGVDMFAEVISANIGSLVIRNGYKNWYPAFQVHPGTLVVDLVGLGGEYDHRCWEMARGWWRKVAGPVGLGG